MEENTENKEIEVEEKTIEELNTEKEQSVDAEEYKQTKKSIKVLRALAGIAVLFIVVYALVKLIPLFANISTEEGRLEIKRTLDNHGAGSIFIVMFLQIAKIFLVVLPGEPIEIMAGMIFGVLKGIVILYIGIIIATFLIHKMVQRYGLALIKDIVKPESYEKIENILNNNQDKMAIVVFVLYFLPGIPKDLITYVGSLLPMDTKKYLFLSGAARFPAVISSVIVGSSILDLNVKKIISVYAVTYIISAIVTIIYKLFFTKDKRKKRKQIRMVRREEKKNSNA